MADKKKKKKRSAGELHRQVQDSVQALPYAIEQQEQQGHRVKAVMLRYLTGPVLRLMNRALSAKRYRGAEGEKLRQTEQMRRHLEQRQAAMKHLQGHIQEQQKRARRGKAK